VCQRFLIKEFWHFLLLPKKSSQQSCHHLTDFNIWVPRVQFHYKIPPVTSTCVIFRYITLHNPLFLTSFPCTSYFQNHTMKSLFFTTYIYFISKCVIYKYLILNFPIQKNMGACYTCVNMVHILKQNYQLYVLISTTTTQSVTKENKWKCNYAFKFQHPSTLRNV
jgi:hypothetical protein